MKKMVFLVLLSAVLCAEKTYCGGWERRLCKAIVFGGEDEKWDGLLSKSDYLKCAILCPDEVAEKVVKPFIPLLKWTIGPFLLPVAYLHLKYQKSREFERSKWVDEVDEEEKRMREEKDLSKRVEEELWKRQKEWHKRRERIEEELHKRRK